jgi:hypothetical protein
MRKTNTLLARQGCPYPLPVPSDVLLDIGTDLARNVPRRLNLALKMWDIAATRGNIPAVYALSRYYLSEKFGHHTAPLSARIGVEVLAEQRDDFKAMTYHARNLSLKNQKKAALPVVMDLCGMTEPEPAAPVTSRMGKAGGLPLPWKSWVNALGYEAAAAPEWQLAWKYGAEIWDDPEACAKHARSTSVVLGSEEWLRSATKAAMAGESSFFQDLGKYYLALHGWFPKARRVSTAPDSRIGFAWLEMAAQFEPLERAANIWAGMALVLREHGNRSNGMEYLQRGLDEIQDREYIDAAHRIEAPMVLSDLIQEWDVEDLVTLHEEKVKSTRFLGQPVIPVQP